MSLAMDDEEVNEFISCRICLIEYDEEIRKPKFLPCSHTLCLPCINSITIYAESIEMSEDEDRLHVLCPFCRKDFQPLGLPNNVYALQMLKEKKIEISQTSLLDVSECLLKNMLLVHKAIDKQLTKTMSSINLIEEKTQKLIEKNNSSLTQIMSFIGLIQKPPGFPASLSTKQFFSGNLLSKFILRLYQSGRLKGEIHIRPAPTFYPEFVQELGKFCYRSPKQFCRSVDKAMAGVFILFAMKNPQFVPAVPSVTEQMDSWTSAAKDIDEVGITMIKSLGDKITDWSFVFILEEKEDFQSHENLPKTVTENELFGHVIHHYMLEPLLRLSLSSKSGRTNYLMTLESQ